MLLKIPFSQATKRTLIYHHDISKPIWLWLEKTQLVKTNLFATAAFTTVANRNSMLLGHEKMLINPRGMGDAALLLICKTRALTYHLFCFLHEVNGLWLYLWPKICCSTEGNWAPVCLNRLTRLTQKNSQVQLLWFLRAENTCLSYFPVFLTSTDVHFLL